MLDLYPIGIRTFDRRMTSDGRAPNVNPHLPRAAQGAPSAEACAEALLGGDRAALSRAITLAESTRPEHRQQAEALLMRCLPRAGRSVRVAVTGPPGVGKSTFIEALGTRLVEEGRRLAVLAIDPTSTRTGGSILGDKTRMSRLATCKDAYVRPSPTAGSLGGVAQSTRATILLCEAAGFDTIFVETVGVGQAEVAAHSMVDLFLLLALAGAGDALQHVKRGIVEMADAIAVTKADGANAEAAEKARAEIEGALRLFPAGETGSAPPVLTCSARTGAGLTDVWQAICDFEQRARASGRFAERRAAQARHGMRQTIEQRLHADFFSCEAVQRAAPQVEADVEAGRLSASAGAEKLLALYRGAEC